MCVNTQHWRVNHPLSPLTQICVCTVINVQFLFGCTLLPLVPFNMYKHPMMSNGWIVHFNSGSCALAQRLYLIREGFSHIERLDPATRTKLYQFWCTALKDVRFIGMLWYPKVDRAFCSQAPAYSCMWLVVFFTCSVSIPWGSTSNWNWFFSSCDVFYYIHQGGYVFTPVPVFLSNITQTTEGISIQFDWRTP